MVSAFKGTVHDSENHISRLLFKLAVEMDMVMNILAAELNASPDAVEYQYRPPEDNEDE